MRVRATKIAQGTERHRLQRRHRRLAGQVAAVGHHAEPPATHLPTRQAPAQRAGPHVPEASLPPPPPLPPLPSLSARLRPTTRRPRLIPAAVAARLPCPCLCLCPGAEFRATALRCCPDPSRRRLLERSRRPLRRPAHATTGTTAGPARTALHLRLLRRFRPRFPAEILPPPRRLHRCHFRPRPRLSAMRRRVCSAPYDCCRLL